MTNVLGWREWVSLPQLGLNNIKAKVDTGARTSALHAFDVHLAEEDGQKVVYFSIHPNQRETDTVIQCKAPLIDEREVRDSGGHSEQRYVIATELKLGEHLHQVELTLTNRDTMGFRMLIGRTAMEGLYIVDPSKSYLIGKPQK